MEGVGLAPRPAESSPFPKSPHLEKTFSANPLNHDLIWLPINGPGSHLVYCKTCYAVYPDMSLERPAGPHGPYKASLRKAACDET